MSLNTCTISGNLGKDAELRRTASGLAILTFSVAVNERRKASGGGYEDYTNWLDCTMFGNRAEALQPYLTRGSKLSIVGHLHKSTYEKDGRQLSKVEIIVDEVELMNGRRDAQTSAAAAPAEVGSVYDSDIPF